MASTTTLKNATNYCERTKKNLMALVEKYNEQIDWETIHKWSNRCMSRRNFLDFHNFTFKLLTNAKYEGNIKFAFENMIGIPREYSSDIAKDWIQINQQKKLTKQAFSTNQDCKDIFCNNSSTQQNRAQ